MKINLITNYKRFKDYCFKNFKMKVIIYFDCLNIYIRIKRHFNSKFIKTSKL